MRFATKILKSMIIVFVTFFIPLVVHFNISAQSFHTVNNKTLTTTDTNMFGSFNHIFLVTIMLLFLFFIGFCYLHNSKKNKNLFIGIISLLFIANFIATFLSDCNLCYILVTSNYMFALLNLLVILEGDRVDLNKSYENEIELGDNIGVIEKTDAI